MREIKFRAWDGGVECGPFDFTDGDSLRYHAENGHPIEQFTGLKDKNGREIWEGDIVKNEGDYLETCAVQFQIDGAVGWCLEAEIGNSWKRCSLISTKANIVIGNIHENPELLTLPNNIPKQTEEV